MAQSQSNLTIGIGVDTGRAIVDLRKFREELKTLNRELTAAVRAGDEPRAQALGQQIAQRTRQYTQLNRAIRETTGALTQQTAAVAGTSSAFGSLGRNIGIAVGGMQRWSRFGLGGLAAALASKAFLDGVDKLNELSSTIKAIGGATGSGDIGGLKAARQTIAATGQAASVADTMIASFNKNLDASRLKGRGDDVGRGTIGGPSVLRGGQDEEVPWDDINKAIDLNTSKRRNNIAIRAEAARKILAETDATKRNEATQREFNVTFAQGEEVLRKWAAQTVPDVGPNPESLERARQAREALENLKTSFSELQTVIVNEFAPSVTQALNAVVGSGFEKEISRQIQLAKSDFQQFKDAADGLLAKWQEADAWIKSHSGLFEKLKQGSPGVKFEPGELSGGQAAGGYIHGPGSGTSDSILARLSNGEFVVRAAAVRRLGLGLLNRLNRYQAGGSVDIVRGGGSGSGRHGTVGSEEDYAAALDAFYQAVAEYQASTGDTTDFWTDFYAGYSTPARRRITRMWLALGKRRRRGGKSVDVGGGGFGDETDAEYFARTGFHYGPRAGETPLGGASPREIPLGRGSAREIPLFAGGLVGAPPIRFAEGGLVSAASSSGRPVHLHLGSQSFALSGSSGVVDALVSHAHSQQIRSAGVKPSWFAGRPSGR